MRAQQIDMTLCGNAYEAMEGCDAVMLVTEWNEFRTLDLHRVKAALRHPVFVDCRNMYDRERMQELGFTYACYGA